MRNRGHGQKGLDWQPEAAEQAPVSQQQSGQAGSDTWTGLIHPRAMLAFFRRRFTTILLVASLVFGLGLVGYMLLPGKYSSQALVLVDPRQPRVTLSEDVLPGIGGDAAALTSLVQIMRSDGFLAKAVSALDLSSDPDYASATSEKALIDAFRSNMWAARQGATYIVEVNVTSKDAKKAASYANGLAELFVNEINDNRLDASTEAAEWLSKRLTLLRTNLKKSEDAVASYQAKAGIVDTGNQNTLDSQQLTSLVTQLATATTEVEDAKARFEQAKRDGVPASSSSGQGDQFLNFNQLLQEQSRLRRQAAELNQTLGSRHPRIMANKEQQRIIAGQIQSEKKRLVQQAGQAYKAAKAKKASLQRQLADARSRAIQQNKQSVELANLQREAKANRDLYEQFLARYKVTDEQSRLQRDEAKIASHATVPLKSNKPSIKLIVPVLAVLGGVLGLVTALVLEAFSTPPSPHSSSQTIAQSKRAAGRKSQQSEQVLDQFEQEELQGRELDPREDRLIDDEKAMEVEKQAELLLKSRALSPRRRAAIERQMAQQKASKRYANQGISQQDVQDYDVQQAAMMSVEPEDEFAELDPQELRTSQLQRNGGRASQRAQRSESPARRPSLRDLAQSQRARRTRHLPINEMMEMEHPQDLHDDHDRDPAYEDNIHPLYPKRPRDLEEAILFSIPQNLYGKLEQRGRFEDSTIRNLADNVLRRNVEVSAFLKDNFNHIDSFLRQSDGQMSRTILISTLADGRAQDLTADVLRDYAIELGLRPLLVTLTNLVDRADRTERDMEGPWSGLQEYDDHDVIHFSVGSMQNASDQDGHWSTRAMESEQFAHLMQICQRTYGLVIIVAPQDQPQEEMDEIVDLFDTAIVVLDQTRLSHQDLSEWQDWAADAQSALVLDRA